MMKLSTSHLSPVVHSLTVRQESYRLMLLIVLNCAFLGGK